MLFFFRSSIRLVERFTSLVVNREPHPVSVLLFLLYNFILVKDEMTPLQYHGKDTTLPRYTVFVQGELIHICFS